MMRAERVCDFAALGVYWGLQQKPTAFSEDAFQPPPTKNMRYRMKC
jgi:hypothetical protein